MSSILTNLRSAVITGFVFAIILIFFLAQGSFDQTAFNMWLLRWLHVLSGVMWVGILYYFNFVQIPNMPNIPDDSVPEGLSEEDNKIVSQHGEIVSTNTLDHLEVTKKIDTELAAKLSGSRFAVLEGDLAKLQRSLITFMLDCAIQNGYKEYYVPFMANEE